MYLLNEMIDPDDCKYEPVRCAFVIDYRYPDVGFWIEINQ